MPDLKKIIASLILASFLSFASAGRVLAAANPYENLPLASAELNNKTGVLVGGKNQNQVLPLASLTKLMSALVLVSLDQNLKHKITVSKAEVDYTLPYIGVGDVTSKIDLRAGDRVTRNDLWQAMLIASSNEAAITLVDHSGLTRKQFVARMNAKAKAWGLKHTKFTEPTGIDPNNLSTAKEMAVIARKAYAYTLISQTSRKPSYACKELTSGRKISIISRNNSLLAMKPVGMKVGYLTEAKINAAVRMKAGAKDRIIIILHSPNNAHRNQEISRLMKL